MHPLRKHLFVGIGVSLFALLLLSFQVASAGSIVNSDFVPLQPTDWNKQLVFPKFNPATGKLTSVEISTTATVSGDVAYENKDNLTATIFLQLIAKVRLQRPDNTQLYVILPNATLTETAGPYDNNPNFAGPSGKRQSLNSSKTENTILTNPTDLAMFTGLGDINLTAIATGTSSASGPGNILVQVRAQAAALYVAIKYNYINPAIDLQKTVYNGHNGGANCQGQELAVGPTGAPVTYCFVVTNTGDTYLNGLVFTDTELGINLSNLTLLSGTLPLAPNAKLVYFYDSTIKAPLLNTANVEATPTDSEGVSIVDLATVKDSDTARVDIVNAAIRLDKTVYGGHNGGISCPGVELVEDIPNTAVTYCFKVTNTGNSYLDSVVITDTTLGLKLPNLKLLNGTLPLAPGASLSYYYTSTIKANLLNTAATEGNPTDAAGHDIAGLPNVTDDDTAEVKLVQPASVGDFVWLDGLDFKELNGLQDADEPGLNGVTVNLLDANGQATGKTTVTANHPTTSKPGWYEFGNLRPGNYLLEFVNPDRLHYAFTSRDQRANTNDTLDSDADKSTGRTERFTLSAGQHDPTRDAGLLVPTAADLEDEPSAPSGRTLFLPGVVK